MARYFEHSASPLYTQVTDAIRERIVKEVWRIGTRIPTLPTLSAEFGGVRRRVDHRPTGGSVAQERRPAQAAARPGHICARYRLLRRIHASERQLTSVISAYIDERIFKLAPRRFRNEVVIPVLLDLKSVPIGSARQILTISTVGVVAANALNTSVSAPVAEIGQESGEFFGTATGLRSRKKP